MTTDQNARASFQRLDQPTDPDPAFAAKLRTQFLSTSAIDETVSAVPLRPTAVRTVPMRRRTRWLDLAAAAVLLIALSGGLLTLAPIQTEQRPATIQAPMSEQPAVMLGGTAAQDNQYPGPNPESGAYEFAALEPLESGSRGPALTYGNRTYVMGVPSSGISASLKAVDITTGKSQWQRESAVYGTFAVTSAGVVVAIPADDKATPSAGVNGESPYSPPFRLALLALDSGTVIWRSANQYGGSNVLTGPFILVDRQRIYVLDRLGLVFALDLRTGDELWRHSYGQTPAPGLDQQICPPDLLPPGDCWPRSDMWSAMAIKGSMLYFSDPASATVTALSTEDGSEKWRVFTPDRVSAKTAVQWLVAFESGVAIQIYDPESQSAELSYVGFWAARDGAEVWSTEASLGYVASDGTALYLNQTALDDSCCTIDRIDATTGKSIWSEFFDQAHFDAYLSSGTLVLGVATLPAGKELLGQFPRVDRLFGIDVNTREVVWRMQMPHVSCWPIFPVADNGEIVCLDFSMSGFGVYRLSATSP